MTESLIWWSIAIYLLVAIGIAILSRQRPAKGGVGTIARITPHLAVGLLRLLIRRCKQGAIMLFGKRLPVQVKGACLAGFAGAFATAVLMHHYTTQRFHARGNPHGVLHSKDQFAGLGGGLIAHAVVWRLYRQRFIIRRLLGGNTESECE